MTKINYLKLAGTLSFIAAAMHVAIIFGGPEWYRFFGAGEQMAVMAEQGTIQPVIMTSLIAFVLAIWAAYAWSGAGILPKLPLLKTVLTLITLIYLVRGFAGFFAPFFSNNSFVSQNSTIFWLASSLISLVIGCIHYRGVFSK